MSKTRFFWRDAFISALSASVSCSASGGMVTRSPGTFVISRSSFVVKAACAGQHGSNAQATAQLLHPHSTWSVSLQLLWSKGQIGAASCEDTDQC